MIWILDRQSRNLVTTDYGITATLIQRDFFYLTIGVSHYTPFRITADSSDIAAIPISRKCGSARFSSMYCS